MQAYFQCFDIRPVRSIRTFLTIICLSGAVIVSGQITCPTFSSGSFGNGGASGTFYWGSTPSGFSKSGNFTFSNASGLSVTAAFINGNQVQNSSGIISGANFCFTNLSSNNITYYSNLNGGNANLRAGTYAFTFSNGTSTATCSYTINSSFAIVSLNAGSIGSNQTICSSTTPSTLSVSTAASGGSTPYSYQWQVSTDGTTFTDINTATNTSYSPGSLSATRYYQLVVTDNNSAVATTNKVTITVGGSAGVWQGTSSTDFNASANWCGSSLPSSSTDVVVGNKTNKPQVTADITVQSLTIENGGSLSFASGKKITATNGITVQPGGSLVGSGDNVVGTVTIQRIINGQRGWRVMSFPFTTASTFSSIASNNNISIETTASLNSANISDVRTYSNSAGTWSDGGTSTVANTPYALFVRGTASEVNKNTYSGGPSAFTYGVSGTMNGATVSFTPGSTSYFSIVGNPYAAPVTTQSLTGGVGSSYYIYQVAQGSTESNRRSKAGSWVASGSNSNTTNTVPVLGVIAYQPANTTTFNITTSDIKTNGTEVSARQTETSFEQMELLLTNKDGDYGDKLFVRFDTRSKPEGTDELDFKKLYNERINLFTLAADNKHLAIDARSKLDTIPLAIYAPAGDYFFKMGTNTLEQHQSVFIKDNYKNTLYELTENSSYLFTVRNDNFSKGEKRFQLFIGNKKQYDTPTTENQKLKVEVLGNLVQGGQVAVRITGLLNNTGLIQIVNTNGQVVKTTTAISGIQYIDLETKSGGLHLLRVSDGSSVSTQKMILQ